MQLKSYISKLITEKVKSSSRGSPDIVNDLNSLGQSFKTEIVKN